MTGYIMDKDIKNVNAKLDGYLCILDVTECRELGKLLSNVWDKYITREVYEKDHPELIALNTFLHDNVLLEGELENNNVFSITEFEIDE